ncbi:aldo/keto reductase [Bacillus halotolerans]|uniref:Aldo/keto reductase n=1 Tax=Bacillus halotolerans TaxID=260554 RepID=A0ABY7I1D6_9BACI|nr:aldo/keto reductase [Bacillus halotolerans]MBT9251838.1 aldo/keto reductase [Bacillus halotolerans]MCR6597003.1 aldo/keto reductase [Bacillus halotolerans]MDG0767468.1 aldo/keto reductase [Bacillus halotolerans]MEC0251030.1 aldo/keto reductase [Bacillus halotolerans]MEC0279744.1 aldo/keto reductase [Bacillus halotolerans]
MDQTRALGQTNLQVKRIGFGANAVGGHNLFPNLNDETGKDLVRTALDGGVNFIDTAFIYGLGRSEELIGEVVQERGVRDQLIIASKGAHKEVNGSIELDNSRDFLRGEVEKSLKRLKTDYIDLYYVHFPDGKTPLAEVAGTLKELKDEGKIKAIGASNLNYQQLQEFNADGYLEVFQSEYSLIQRDAEKELLPYCEKHGISFIPYFPLASGLLTGKFTKDDAFDDIRKDKPQFQGDTFIQNLKKVDKLKAAAEEKNAETAHVALAWLLTRPAVDAIIPGAKRPEQLKANLKTLDVELTDDEADFISEIFK